MVTRRWILNHIVAVDVLEPVEVLRTRRWWGGWRIHWASQYQAKCSCGWVSVATIDMWSASEDGKLHRLLEHPGGNIIDLPEDAA